MYVHLLCLYNILTSVHACKYIFECVCVGWVGEIFNKSCPFMEDKTTL